MPTTTATLLMQFDTGSGYGTPVTGGQVVPAGTTVKLTAASYAGWGAPAGDYEIPAGSYPEGWPCPAGWTTYADGSYHYLASAITGYAPPPFTLPDVAAVASGLFGKWGFVLTVNGGGAPGLVDSTCAVEIISQTGIHDLLNREGAQFGGVDRRWAGPVQENWRALDSAIAGGVGGGVSLGSGTPAKVRATAGIQGALAVAAPFDHRHEVEIAAPVALGTSLAAGAQTTLALSDHVHTLPFAVLSAVLSAATGNIGFNGMKLVNVGAPTASGDVVTYDYANALVNFANVNAALGMANANIGINGWQITGSGAPTTSSSLTTKAYVDALAIGLDLKQEVRGSSLANHTLSGALTEDGLAYSDGERYLARHQTNAWENGIYIVNTAGAWTRATDADTSAEVTPGMFVFVIEGTANGKTGWALLGPGPITLGTTNLVFTQIFGPGATVAGAGLTSSGNTINVIANADGSINVNANDVQVGVLATDAQHGVRGGGTQHAAVTTSVNGFMLAPDKVRLDGMGDGATVVSITGSGPVNITGTDANPNINVDAATGAAAGSMSAAHYTLVNGATASATASTLAKRGASSEIAFGAVTADALSIADGGITTASAIALTPKTDTYGATVTMRGKDGGRHEVTLTGNVTFAAPTFFANGARFEVFVTQGGAGSYTTTWTSGVGGFYFPVSGGLGAAFATSAGDCDYYEFLHRSLPVSHWVCVQHTYYSPP